MSAWSEAEIKLLREGAAAGLSTAVIAKQIGRGITRNAVIGKARRQGIALGNPVGFTNGNNRGKPGVVKAKPAKSVAIADTDRRNMRKGIVSGNVIAMKRDPKPPALPVFEPNSYDAAGLRISLMKNTGCKWPLGDPKADDFGFCGHPRLEGNSYCHHHKLRASQSFVRSEVAA